MVVCVQCLVPQEEEKVFIVASPECLKEIYWGSQTPGQSLHSEQEVDGEHSWWRVAAGKRRAGILKVRFFYF